MTAISQIYITDSLTGVPPVLMQKTDTVKAAFPDHDYTLYSGETLRAFIESEFDRDVLNAFDTLKPYAYKSDLGRYCLLFKKGGWYFDISIHVNCNVTVSDDTRLIVFREANSAVGTPWAVTTSIIYSKPNNAAFQKAIDIVVGNCRSKYYGINPLCPTGPNAFGEAIATVREKEGMIVGDTLDLTPTHQTKNRGSVLPDGTIFAWHKANTLISLSKTGTNDYNDFWHNRTVYGEVPLSPPKRKLSVSNLLFGRNTPSADA